MAKVTVGQWVAKSLDRLDAVWRQSAQDVAIEVQTPQSKGGRLPVDTSFLRNSFAAANGTVPTAPSVKPESFTRKDYNFSPVAVVLTQAKMGDTVVFGWGATYAIDMEARYSFVRHGVQRWDQIVSKAARKVKARVTG
ncbi:hypothetical protein [Marinobacter alexandrii]|uniref:hypothetical protein n=1 Tax=Marinobacter alexandrii TaxID=2570351 RepID=UPI001108D680|nr:hypothetical protein [Marinobacter alexandrii]